MKTSAHVSTAHRGNPRREPRILMVTPRYAPDVGGVEQHVHEVASRLSARGCKVGVLTTDRTGERLPRELVGDVSVRRVPARPAHRDYYFAPGIYREVLSGRDDWDLVHVQSYHTFVAPFAMAAARRAGLPYILTFHGGGHSSRVRQRLRAPQQRVLRPFIRGAAKLVAVASFEIGLYGNVYSIPGERFALIPNGTDASFQRTTAAPRDGLIVSVGRLERYKGHHRILAALPEIRRQRPDAQLWIAGSGPFEHSLWAQARALDVAEHVEIRAIPADDRPRMAQELGAAALVVLLSDYETHPLAVLEALALGRPALVADTSGLSELAERGLVAAIPAESSPTDVAAAVLNQLAHPRSPPEFRLPTWDDCADGLLALYDDVLASR